MLGTGLFSDNVSHPGSDSAGVKRLAGILASAAQITWRMLMEEAYSAGNSGPVVAESQTFAEQEVLERAIAKLVLLGKQVGVSADQMILLLESGLTVVELVECLAARDEKRCPS
jgi:hypothetical protein